MLSSQCDELRQVAQVYRNLGKYATEQMLLDAADTILELRDDLQRANSNLQDAEHDESVAWDRVRKAERESAKLRELAVLNWEWAHNACCKDTCKLSDKYCGDGIDQDCNYERRIYDLMQELGIEVPQ